MIDHLYLLVLDTESNPVSSEKLQEQLKHCFLSPI